MDACIAQFGGLDVLGNVAGIFRAHHVVDVTPTEYHRVMAVNVDEESAMDVRAIADKLEIQEQLARYARGVDTHDWELWKSVFTEDATVDYSQSGVICGPRDEVAAFLSEAFSAIPWATHHITNVEIDLDGDQARVRAMFFNPMQIPGMEESSSTGGYYHHDFVRTADGWKSTHLVEEPVWFLNRPGG